MSQPDNNIYKKIFTLAAVGMARVSFEWDFLEVNNKLCEILGISELELLHKSCHNFIYPEDIDKDANQHNQLLSGETKDQEH